MPRAAGVSPVCREGGLCHQVREYTQSFTENPESQLLQPSVLTTVVPLFPATERPLTMCNKATAQCWGASPAAAPEVAPEHRDVCAAPEMTGRGQDRKADDSSKRSIKVINFGQERHREKEDVKESRDIPGDPADEGG